MKSFFDFKQWSKFILLLISFSFIGIIGRVSTYGSEIWNFLFENMIWFPVEVGITIFIFDKIIQKNNLKIENNREYNEYYSVAETDLNKLLETIKLHSVSAITNSQLQGDELDKEFANVCNNIPEVITINNLREGLDTQVLNPDNVIDSIINPKFIRKSYYDSLGESGANIISNIYSHYMLYSKFIPVDLYRELNDLRDFFESNIYFSTNDNLKFGRSMLVQRENEGLMQDNEYQQTIDILTETYSALFEKLMTIENIINESKLY